MTRLAGLLMGTALLATPAAAGTLYRCVGPDGVPNYTSRKVAGSQCRVVTRTRDAATTGLPAPPAPASSVAVNTPPARPGAPTARAADSVVTEGFVPRFLRMGHSTIYTFVDANGVRNFSNHRPRGGASGLVAQRISYPIFSQPSCYACASLPGVSFGAVALNTTAFSGEIRAAASEFGVEEAVVRAIIHAESAFRPHVVSPKNAQGLMQLIPATASRFGVSDPFDPGENIRGGVRYLSWLMKRYGANLTEVAAAYNAGEGAVDRYGGVPPYAETQRYVQRVSVLADRYRKALGAN